MGVKINIDADDFGESVHPSEDILDCLKAGKLDSISVTCKYELFSNLRETVSGGREGFPQEPKDFCCI